MNKIGVVKFDPLPTKATAVEVAEALCKDITSGKVVAFIVTAIMDNDEVLTYAGSSKPVSRLRMFGAAMAMQHAMQAGAITDDQGGAA